MQPIALISIKWYRLGRLVTQRSVLWLRRWYMRILWRFMLLWWVFTRLNFTTINPCIGNPPPFKINKIIVKELAEQMVVVQVAIEYHKCSWNCLQQPNWMLVYNSGLYECRKSPWLIKWTKPDLKCIKNYC